MGRKNKKSSHNLRKKKKMKIPKIIAIVAVFMIFAVLAQYGGKFGAAMQLGQGLGTIGDCFVESDNGSKYFFFRNTDWIDELDYSNEELNISKDVLKEMVNAELDSYESQTLTFDITSSKNELENYIYDYGKETYACRLPWQFIYAVASLMEASEDGKITENAVKKVEKAFTTVYDKKYDYYGSDKTSYKYKTLKKLPHKINGNYYEPMLVMNSADNYLFEYTCEYVVSDNKYVLKKQSRKADKEGFLKKMEKIGLCENDVRSIIQILEQLKKLDKGGKEEDQSVNIIIKELKYVVLGKEKPDDNWKNSYGLFELYSGYDNVTGGGIYDGGYMGTDTCVDGLVYDNPEAPLFSGPFAAKAKAFKPTLRKLMREKGIEPYIDVYLSMLANECSLNVYTQITYSKIANRKIHNPGQVLSYKGMPGASVKEEALGSIRAGLDNFKNKIEICKKYGVKDVAAVVQAYNFGEGYVYIINSTDKKDTATNRARYTARYHQGTPSYSTNVMSRVKGQKLSAVSSAAQTVSGGTAKGREIVAYAKRFVGNPYVWGGTSLTHGADCSGFVMSVWAHFGYSLPRTARDQCSSFAGKYKEIPSIDQAQPGDLFYYLGTNGVVGHVTMYAGNKQVVHAASTKSGIKMSSYNYRQVYKIYRLLPDTDKKTIKKVKKKSGKMKK